MIKVEFSRLAFDRKLKFSLIVLLLHNTAQCQSAFFQEHGMQSAFPSTGVAVIEEGGLCSSATISGNLNVLDTHVSHSRAVACIADLDGWQRRLGHVFHDGLKQLCKKRSDCTSDIAF